MQDFETFEQVFYFFVTAALDEKHVTLIDTDEEQQALTRSIQELHTMRQQLCGQILKQMGSSPMLQSFVTARGIVQYNTVPNHCECIFSKKKLRPDEGTLIVIDHQHLFTFDKRFTLIVFYFWYIVHLPEELILNALKWMKTTHWWQNGTMSSTEAVTRLRTEQSSVAKQAYVKLTSVCNYIQTEMTNIRINA